MFGERWLSPKSSRGALAMLRQARWVSGQLQPLVPGQRLPAAPPPLVPASATSSVRWNVPVPSAGLLGACPEDRRLQCPQQRDAGVRARAELEKLRRAGKGRQGRESGGAVRNRRKTNAQNALTHRKVSCTADG